MNIKWYAGAEQAVAYQKTCELQQQTGGSPTTSLDFEKLVLFSLLCG